MCVHHVHALGYRLSRLGYPDLAHHLVDVLDDMIAGNLGRAADLLNLEIVIASEGALEIVAEMIRVAERLSA